MRASLVCFFIFHTSFLFNFAIGQQQEIAVNSNGFYSDTSDPGVQWFPDARFGIFVHWTLTCVPLLEGEGQLSKMEQARNLAQRFSADNYNPGEWATLFKKWGAKYVVLTTKHHVGFTLFDSPVSNFSVMNSSPVKKDLVKDYVEAMRAVGLKVGLYYSLPDWSHPDYASLKKPKSRSEDIDPMKYSVEDDTVRWNRFIKDMFAEVRHLCTNYGRIDLFWFDGDWERTAEQWHSMELAMMIDSLQPGAVLNNRLKHKDLGHYGTPEQIVPLGPRKGWWELCLTPGDNWAGEGADSHIKTPRELIRIFGDVLHLGGNLLLNVSPNDNGAIPVQQLQVMNEVGKWVTNHQEAIYNTSSPLPWGLFNGAVTHDDQYLYLIAYDRPRDELVLKGTENDVLEVTHLLSGDHLSWRYSGGYKGWNRKGWLYIKIPEKYMDEYATVVRIRFKESNVTFRLPDGGSKIINFHQH